MTGFERYVTAGLIAKYYDVMFNKRFNKYEKSWLLIEGLNLLLSTVKY